MGRILLSFTALMLITGCAYFTSWNDVMGGWIGKPISRIEKLWGPADETRTRADGNKVYKYHLEDLDPSCVHYWIVNSEGTIVDFYDDGYCRPVG